MSKNKASTSRFVDITGRQRRHFWSVILVFSGLGLNVGVWTVLVADLANALRLSPVQLGFAISCFSSAGIVSLFAGGPFADRLTRRQLLAIGVSGPGLFFGGLALASNYPLLLVILLFGGACSSCYDLAANTLGGDFERQYQSKSMTQFHSGFSGGAALGALVSAVTLNAHISFRIVYAATGLFFLVLAIAVWLLPLVSVSQSSLELKEQRSAKGAVPSILALFLTPIVLLATALVCLSFFTDGALEGYISVYLRDLLGSGVLLSGIGIAAFYLVGMLGRLGSTAALRRFGDRPIITIAALISFAGLAISLATTSASLAVAGLILVGLGQAPLVPTAFSQAAQVGSDQAVRAVALVTACGYSIFLVSPLLIGLLADRVTLRGALLLTLATSLCVVLIAQRLPKDHHADQPAA